MATDPVCGMGIEEKKAPVTSSTRGNLLLLQRALSRRV